MFEKIKNSLFNIFLLCVAFGMLFFVKVNSYADIVRDETYHVTSYNGTTSSSSIISSFDVPVNMRVCFYYNIQGYFEGAPYGTYSLFTNYNGNVPYRLYVDGQTNSSVFSSSEIWENIFLLTPRSTVTAWGNNRLSVYSDYGSSCPIFYDEEDCRSYLINGTLPTLPFDETLKLDKFNVISKGDWVQEFLNGHVRFDHIVCQPFWSDERIDTVELSVYALDSNFNYQPRNFTFESDQSGQFHDFDISGLTLHGQKFVVRATPYSLTNKGVSIAYEFVFPNEFTQPLGDLVIKEPNVYPYSTTIDISGNDVPVEWTVTQTPIYIYETNNVENYYYGDNVSYPVPEITETTNENYYQDYISNYYNDYSTVVNNYNNSFEFNFGDISSNDIETGYNNVGDFLDGIGSLISKLAQLLSGLFPFLSPLVSATLIGVIALVVVIGGIVLFIKLIRNLLP